MKKTDMELQSILNKMKLISSTYQVIRIIDPMSKKVYLYCEKEIFESELSCYKLWKKHQPCENCIGMRALDEDDTFVKVEYIQDDMFMVIAVPVIINQKKMIVELPNNISGRLVIDGGVQGKYANDGAIPSRQTCHSALTGDEAAEELSKHAETTLPCASGLAE